MASWASCTFQSVERQDQLVFTLLGGVVAHLGARCRVWDARGDSCACRAPPHLLGWNHTVVELGANDGLHMSNSYFFSKRLGWRSVLIEANPNVYKRLVKHRPNEGVTINGLIGDPRDFPPDGRASFYAFYRPGTTEKANTALDWETGLSGVAAPNGTNTALRSLADARRAAVRYGVSFRHMRLPVMRLTELLRGKGVERVDIFFLDVEGAELSVLRTLNFRRIPVHIMVVERPTPQVTHLLKRNGFKDLQFTYDSGGDRVFVNGNY